jgi:Fe-S-cluster-containing dehydrogenase component/DNA-binding NarL/FixJ family response regulator
VATLIALSAPEAIPRRWRAEMRRRSHPHRLLARVDDPDEAERIIAERRPDLVLLDVARPREEALALCRRMVAACEAADDAPVVALAPRLDDEERGALLDAGARGYVLSTMAPPQAAIALQAIAEVNGRGGREPAGGSRADFLRMGALALAASAIAAGRAMAVDDPTPSPSSPGTMPELPPPAEGEDVLLRMQRELIRAMRKPVGERKWVMVIDQRKCTGCDACTISCKTENQLPPGVVYRPVVEEEVGEYPNVGRRFLPRPCMQCERPPCTPVCPVGATWRRADGVTVVDYERCIGCRYCLAACPYSARTSDFGEYYTESTPGPVQPYEEQTSPEYLAGFRRSTGGSPIGNARKCHFCLHRLENGMLPSCVTTCIGRATFFGDANDPDSLVSELVARPNARRLKEELGTEPRVYYLS